MRTSFSRAALPLLLVSSVLSGCASTSSKGEAVLNQENWPFCTVIGALAGGGLGAIESSSAAGIGAGGRTGLTALVVAVLFAISSFFSPVVSIVPNAATAPILIIVGVMMLSNLKSVDWEDLSEAIPAFFTSIFMGFSYSITYGIAAGFLTYTLVKIVKGQAKDVHFIMWILDILFILNFISMAVF